MRTRARAERSGPGRWWLADNDTKLYESIFATCQRIEGRQGSRRMELDRYQALYENEGNSKPGKSGRIPISWRSGRLSFNVVRSCIDTVTAKIAKNRPRVSFVTSDGDFAQQQKAKDLETFMDGVFNESGIYQEAPRAFTDACIGDGGALRLFVEDVDGEVPQLKCERVLAQELLIDETEAVYGKPRQLHQKRRIAREVLEEMYPDKAQLIADAPASRVSDDWEGDMIEVVESWHLPSKSGGDDGRHAIVIDGVTLHQEQYTKDYFPFVFFFWSLRPMGFWGTGIANELLGIQSEINALLKIIMVAQRRMGSGRVLLPKGSGVSKESLTDEPGSIIEVNMAQGSHPVWAPGITVAPEMYSHLDRLVRGAYEFTGISQSSAEGKKPAGDLSGIALREVNDIETGRYAMRALRYERVFLDAARIFIDMARDLAKEGKFIKAKSTAGKFLSTIPWNDVDMTDDEFVMDLWPTGLLPETPEGKFQKATEMVEAGFIDGDTAVSLLDMPDVKSVTSLKTAALDNARMVVDSMLAGGRYIEPEPFWNLELTRSIANSAYLKAQCKPKYTSEENMEKLRDLMDACTAMIAAKASPAATGAPATAGANPEAPPPPPPGMPGPGGMPGMPPLGVPGAPQVSDLLPLPTAAAA